MLSKNRLVTQFAHVKGSRPRRPYFVGSGNLHPHKLLAPVTPGAFAGDGKADFDVIADEQGRKSVFGLPNAVGIIHFLPACKTKISVHTLPFLCTSKLT